jgi:hypothetical protein
VDVLDAPTYLTFGRVFILLLDRCSLTMGSKTYVQLLSYNNVKTQNITYILSGKLWCERGRQVDILVVDVPDAPTHHTFGRVVIMLVD